MKKKTLFYIKMGREPQYELVLAQADLMGFTMPSSSQNTVNNDIIKYQKSLNGGQWKYDLFYYFSQEAGLIDFAKLNWGDPTQFYLTHNLTHPTYVPGSGFKSIGGTPGSFSTGYIPAIHANNITATRYTKFWSLFDVDATPAATYYTSGCRAANDAQQLFNFYQSGSLELREFNTATITRTLAQSALNKHYQVSKDGVSGTGHCGLYYDGVYEVGGTSLSGGLTPTYPIYILAANNAGSHFGNGARNIGMKYFALGDFFGTQNVPPLANEADIYAIMNGTF